MATAKADTALALQSEARQLSAALGEPELEGYAAFYHGLTQALNLAVLPARADLDAARDLHRRAQAPAGEAMATATLGLTFLMTGEPERARQLLEQAVAMQRAADTAGARDTPASTSPWLSTPSIRGSPPRTTATPWSASGRIATRRCCRWR